MILLNNQSLWVSLVTIMEGLIIINKLNHFQRGDIHKIYLAISIQESIPIVIAYLVVLLW